MSKRSTFVPLTGIKGSKSEAAAGDGISSLGNCELPGPDNTKKGYVELPSPEGLPSSRLDRVFVNFGKKNPRGFYGIEMGCISRPIAFVKRVVVPDIDRRRDVLRKTCHPNLVNLTDVFINQDTVYFTYEKSGLSLKELQDMDDVTFDRIAVATICKEVLKGLIYMQEELGLYHGHLDSDCVYVNEDGGVKIGDVGNSMLAKDENQGTAHDIQSVYNLAANLLDLSRSSEKDTMSFHLAEDFTLLPSDVTFQEVMTHPFLALAQDPWYLAYLGLMYTFGLQQHTWFKTPLHQGKGRKFSERN